MMTNNNYFKKILFSLSGGDEITAAQIGTKFSAFDLLKNM